MRTVLSIVGQALVLCLIGAAIGLGVNGCGGLRHFAVNTGLYQSKDSHDYIDLFRDYFRKSELRPIPGLGVGAPASNRGDGGELSGGEVQPADPADSDSINLAAPSEEHPFRTISLKQAIKIHEDMLAGRGYIVFVDARATASFESGRIPGAIQCDYYRPDEVVQLAPQLYGAEKIVVYCNGNDCEDSLMVCGGLIENEVPWHSIYLFKGGWEAWEKSGQPCERGPARE